MSNDPSAAALQLPRVTEPISAPSTLQNLVEEYNSRAKLGEVAPCSLLLKDALGYFARYYAAVCVAACRELDCLPGEVAQTWAGTPSVEVALPTLKECLERLRGREERIARKLCLVFFEQDGESRVFTRHCLPTDIPQDFHLSEFCATEREKLAELDRQVLEKAAMVLDAWISASFPFFLESEQRLETGAYFGQLEQVVQFEQYTLRTGLNMRVHESRGLAPLPALAPEVVRKSALARPDSGLLPKLPPTAAPQTPQPEATPEISEQAPASPSPAPDVTEQAPDPPPEEKPIPTPVIAPEALALQQFVAAQQARSGPTTSPERKVLAEVRLDIRLEPMGFMRSTTGKMGYGGFFWISSQDEHPVTGVVTATGGNVEITPSFFDGPTNRVGYWVHPDDVLSSKEYVKIKSGNEERLYALWRLAPPSRFEALSRGRQAGLLVLPGLLGTLYSIWILYSTHQKVDLELRQTLGENYERFINATRPLSLKQAGIGQLDVNIKPQIESSSLIFFAVAWLTPVVVSQIYARFPRKDQRPLVLLYLLGCLWPVLAFLALWGSPLTQGVVVQHPELAQLDYRRGFVYFFVLNSVNSLYSLLSIEGFFHRFFNALGRLALGALMATLSILLILVQVYGTSWFT